MRLRFFAFLLALSLCVPLSGAWAQSLPALGDASRGVLTPAQEMELGRSLLREVRRVFSLHTDPELGFYVESLGTLLSANAQDASGGFHFLTIDDRSVNAFAMPGGIIGVFSGLILETRDEAELAAVIAHEIAHVTQRHLARRFARDRDVGFATGLAVLAGILAAGIDPQLGQAVITGGMAAGVQSRLDYSRSAEAEADRIGMQILASSGLHPDAMGDFFERLQALSRGSPDSVPEYLRTHPVNLERVSDARNRARGMSGDFRRDLHGDFVWMQARARAFTQPERSGSQFMAESNQSPVRIYEAAVAELLLGHPERARGLRARLEPSSVPTPTLDLLDIAILRGEGNHETALDHLLSLNTIFPAHPVVTWLTAQTQSDMGDADAALRTIDRHLRFDADPAPRWFRLRAEAADVAGRNSTRHEAMGEYFFHLGQYDEAVRQFDVAMQAPDANRRDIERIEHKRDTVREIARRDER